MCAFHIWLPRRERARGQRGEVRPAAGGAGAAAGRRGGRSAALAALATLATLLAAAGCGHAVPRPNPTVVAGAAAATAAALTLADRDAAVRNATAEEALSRQLDRDRASSDSGHYATAAVLDRLDAAEQRAKRAATAQRATTVAPNTTDAAARPDVPPMPGARAPAEDDAPTASTPR
jgi:hypothetical protein